MLKKQVGEDLRLDALDRLRAVTHQQLSFSAMAEPPEEREGKLSARCEGFSLQAGRHLHEKDREGLEALLRYCSGRRCRKNGCRWPRTAAARSS
jgi:hypothetical protein